MLGKIPNGLLAVSKTSWICAVFLQSLLTLDMQDLTLDLSSLQVLPIVRVDRQDAKASPSSAQTLPTTCLKCNTRTPKRSLCLCVLCNYILRAEKEFQGHSERAGQQVCLVEEDSNILKSRFALKAWSCAINNVRTRKLFEGNIACDTRTVQPLRKVLRNYHQVSNHISNHALL